MKSMLLCCVFLLCSVGNCLQAVDNLRLPDMRSGGMGGNGVTQSVYFNPALVPLSTSRQIDINYFNQYGLKELGTVSGSFQYPNPVLSVGLHVASFGYDEYRESLFRLFLGKQLGEQWTLGVAVQYAILQTSLFEESPSCLSTDIGATFKPIDKLLIGLLIMNLPSVMISDKDVQVKDFNDYSVQIGFQWEIINSLLIVGSVLTNEQHPISGSAGIEYTPFSTFRIRAGVQGNPFLPTMGVGYSFSKFTVNAAAVYHPVLGISMGLGLLLSF